MGLSLNSFLPLELCWQRPAPQTASAHPDPVRNWAPEQPSLEGNSASKHNSLRDDHNFSTRDTQGVPQWDSCPNLRLSHAVGIIQNCFVRDWDQALDPNLWKHVVNVAQNTAAQPRRTEKIRFLGKFKLLWVLIHRQHLCLQLVPVSPCSHAQSCSAGAIGSFILPNFPGSQASDFQGNKILWTCLCYSEIRLLLPGREQKYEYKKTLIILLIKHSLTLTNFQKKTPIIFSQSIN